MRREIAIVVGLALAAGCAARAVGSDRAAAHPPPPHARLRFAVSRRRLRHEYQDERWGPLEILPDVLTTVRVADLPAPHHLFKCLYADRSGELVERYEDSNETDPGRAGRQFLSTLTVEEAARCPYHRADWQTVGALSVAVLARIQDGLRREKALAAISRRHGLGEEDESALRGLFWDPIHWGFGADGLDNGQHRVCALKMSGAELCVVER